MRPREDTITPTSGGSYPAGGPAPWARAKRSRTLLVNTWLVLALTAWLTARTAPHLVESKGGVSQLVGFFSLFFALLGICQGLATFARSAEAARTTAVLSFVIGAIFALQCVMMLGDRGSARWAPPPALAILLVAAIAGYAVFTGVLNLRWAEQLRTPTPPPAGVCVSCGYDLRATPDRCPECGTRVAPAAAATAAGTSPPV